MSGLALVCGTLAILGRPAPGGFVSLEARGSGESRYLARVKEGSFCVEAPYGRYAVLVSPPNHAHPGRAVARGGAPLAELDLRAGTPAPKLELELVAQTPAPSRLSGELVFEGGKAPEGPVLVMAAAADTPASSDAGARYAFAWAEAGADGRRRFELAVSTGYLGCLEVWADGWAPASMTPPLWQPQGAALALAPGGAQKVSLSMRRAGRLSGRVTLPGGKPFAPRLGARTGLHRVRVEGLLGDYVVDAYADAEGRYEVPAVARGIHTLTYLSEGEELGWRPRRAALAWMDEGAALRADAPVRPSGRLLVPYLEPPLSEAAAAPGEDLWLVGLPAGAPFEPHRLLLHDEAPVAVYRSAPGDWRSWDAPRRIRPFGAAFEVEAGTYDLYLVASGPLGRWARLLARARGVKVPARGEGVARLAAASPAAPGGGALDLEVAGWKEPSLSEMRRASSLAGLLSHVVLTAELRDASGAVAGWAFSTLEGWEGLPRFQDALDHDDPAALKAAEGSPRRMRAENFPAGRYRLTLTGRGAPKRETDAVLAAGSAAAVRLDLGAR